MASGAEVAMGTIRRGGTGAATQAHISVGTNSEILQSESVKATSNSK